MTGDYTRNTFRPRQYYSAVRMQQGRVFLDADWNEQTDIVRWFEHVTNGDVIGDCGFPQDTAGFELIPLPGDLAIGPGRAYVGGRLVENPLPAAVELTRITGNDSRYQVTGGPRLRKGQPIAPSSGSPWNPVAVAEAETKNGVQTVTLSGPTDGATTQLVTAGASVGAQPHLLRNTVPKKEGHYLAYLEVWDRPIFALEEPRLREVALGGPDTAGREQRIWQLRLHPLPGGDGDNTSPRCENFAGWRPEAGASAVRLSARASETSAAEDPCALPAAGGYRSLQNHLYRVEIHNGGSVDQDTVTWKWSRDNASHRARLTEVTADSQLVVDSRGPDPATEFTTNDWVEVLDEDRILASDPGFFVRISTTNGNRLSVGEILDPDTLDPLLVGSPGVPDVSKLPSTGYVRRWEGGKPVVLVPDTQVALENGVEVTLGEGVVRTGDYWTVPARTVVGDVEWPSDPSSGKPLPLSPEGVARDYCPVAVVHLDGQGQWTVEDCRPLFPPLTNLGPELRMLGGDGQLLCVDEKAPSPLRVGLFRGNRPLAEAVVEFSVTSGDATVVAENGGQVGADGIVKATITAGSNPLQDDGVVTIVAAPTGVATEPAKLEFTARFANADCVYIRDDVCGAAVEHTGLRSVAAVLEYLCERGGTGKEEGIHVRNVLLPDHEDGLDTLPADSIVEWRELLGGIEIQLDGPVDPKAMRGQVGKVSFDQPHPLAGDEAEHLAAFVDGPEWLRQETEIVGTFRADGQIITWTPIEPAAEWLRGRAQEALQKYEPRQRPARLTLHGDRVWSQGDPRMLLDGNLFADPRSPSRVEYPSGDGVRGGDLVLPFRLGSRAEGSLFFVPVLGGPFFGSVDPQRLQETLRTALRFGIDRAPLEPIAEDLGISLTPSTPDPDRARRAVEEAGMTGQTVAMMAGAPHQPIVEAVVRQVARHGVDVQPTITTAQDERLAYLRKIRQDAVDLLLVDGSLEQELRNVVGPQLGRRISL